METDEMLATVKFANWFRTLLVFVTIVMAAAFQLHAAIVPFNLQGKAGLGLLPGNENVVVNNGGTGGLLGTGIQYDDVTRDLSINVGWGSGRGFVNLSGDATQMHIHGPAAFNQDAGVLLTLNNLPGFNASGINGGFIGTVNIPLANVSDLLAGRLYINVHTGGNSSGEIRGNLTAVPEPTSMCLLSLAVSAAVWRSRSRRLREPGLGSESKIEA